MKIQSFGQFFVLSLFIFSASTSAQELPTEQPSDPLPPMLTATQVSGWVPVEYVFSKTCTVDFDGQFEVTIKTDFTDGTWQRVTTEAKKLKAKRLKKIQRWVEDAQNGPFLSGHRPCDIGAVNIRGTVTGRYFPIADLPDCGKSTVNQHPSSLELMKWVKEHCSFEFNI